MAIDAPLSSPCTVHCISCRHHSRGEPLQASSATVTRYMNLKDVEKVEITCLVDNNVDVLLPSSEVASRPAIPPDWFKRPLLAEHGFCAVLTVQSNGSSRALVIDSGLDPYTALHNAGVLGLDLKGCQG